MTITTLDPLRTQVTITSEQYPDGQNFIVKNGSDAVANDATLTIQQNGTTVGTFTANAATDKSIDISVPTTTSQLTNNSGFVSNNNCPSVNICDLLNAIDEMQDIIDSLRDAMTRPAVTTVSVSSVTYTTAVCEGYVTSGGGSDITERGFCCGTSPDPTVADSKVAAGGGPGTFTCSLSGLASGTAYYVRAYATNGAGTAYGTQKTFTTPAFACGISTETDVDGNVYNTVQIGSQCWMKENLRTTKYSDGTAIALGSSTSSSTAYRYAPNGDVSNVPAYGYLYNWAAVMNGAGSSSANPSGVQGICPAGWHVPSDAEWTQLTDYVSSQSQYQCNGSSVSIAKALASPTGWSSSSTTCAVGNNPSGNNATGFSALPAGYYNGSYGSYGNYACFMSSTENNSNNVYYHYLSYGIADVVRFNYNKDYGRSVRCLRNAEGLPAVRTAEAASTSCGSAATVTAVVENQGTSGVTERGVCYGTSPDPTVADSKVAASGAGAGYTCSLDGLAAGTYYVRAYATNGAGTSYGNQLTFEVGMKDVDGNVYNTVQIGSQCWMKENLRTTKYSDGTAIALGSSTSSSTAYRYAPNGDVSNVPAYGYLYNWAAVMNGAGSSSANPSGVQGICPAGWHVPSDAEWTQLTDYVSSQSQYQCNGSSVSIAKALASPTGWSSSSLTCAVGNNPSGNNATGFSALPAGYSSGSYSYFGRSASFWISTEYNSDNAIYRNLLYNNAGVGRFYYNKNYGCSVRCLRN